MAKGMAGMGGKAPKGRWSIGPVSFGGQKAAPRQTSQGRLADIDALLAKGAITEDTANLARSSLRARESAEGVRDERRKKLELDRRLFDREGEYVKSTKVQPEATYTKFDVNMEKAAEDRAARKAFQLKQQAAQDLAQRDAEVFAARRAALARKAAEVAGPDVIGGMMTQARPMVDPRTGSITDITPAEIAQTSHARDTIADAISESGVQQAMTRGPSLREKLIANKSGVAAMDPMAELAAAEQRMRLARATPAAPPAIPEGSAYTVISELGGDMPGQILQDAQGRQFFAPAYGPLAGELIEMGAQAGVSEMQQFAMGPPGATRPMPQVPPVLPQGRVAQSMAAKAPTGIIKAPLGALKSALKGLVR